MRYGRFFLGVLLTLLFVGVVAGVGWTAYNQGVAQGFIAGGNVTVVAPEGGVAPNAPMVAPYGWYAPYGFHHPWGFGLFGCLVPLFFIFLIFAAFRFFMRPRWGGGRGASWMYGGPNNWDPSQGDVPDRVKEWHRKLHEQEAGAPSTGEGTAVG